MVARYGPYSVYSTESVGTDPRPVYCRCRTYIPVTLVPKIQRNHNNNVTLQ